MAKKERVAKEVMKATESALARFWGFIAWVTGILVALAVGFGMISQSLVIPDIPSMITQTAGWIVVILTALGAILAIIDKLMK